MTIHKWSEIKDKMTPERRARVDAAVQTALQTFDGDDIGDDISDQIDQTTAESYMLKDGFDLQGLAHMFPEAYSALPEAYRNDNCLRFFVDRNDNLCAEPKNPEDKIALGDSEWLWVPLTNQWQQGK